MAADKIFKYGKLERDFDITDYNTTERWDAAIKTLETKGAEVDAQEDANARVKGTFFALGDFIDTVLGEGAFRLAVGKTDSLDAALDAYVALVTLVNTQNSALNDKLSALMPKVKR